VSKAVDYITEKWQKSAEAAESIAESTAKTLGIYEAIFASRRTDEQNLERVQKRLLRIDEEIQETFEKREKIRTQTLPGVGFGGSGQRKSFSETEVVTRQDNPERRNELATEAAELAKEESALKTKIAEKETKQQEESFKNEVDQRQKIADINEENSAKLRTDEEQLSTLKQRRQEISIAANEDDLQTKLAVAELDGKILDIEKKITDEKERQQKEQERLNRELRKAEGELRGMRRQYADALLDQSGITLAEAAQGNGSARARTLARRAMMYEDKARRVRSMGGEYRNASGQIISTEQQAKLYQSQANSIRGYISELTGAEQDPLRSMSEAITKSEEHLAEIKEELKPKAIASGSPSKK
jgi:hypothetical protein